jgi:hypothetical protein
MALSRERPNSPDQVRDLVKRLPIVPLMLALTACGDGSTGPSGSVAIDPPGTSTLTVGDELTLTATAGQATGLTWVSADTAVAGVRQSGLAAIVEARRPGTGVVQVRLPDGAMDEVTLQVVPRPGGYQTEAIDYFAEIAFGAEYGSSTPRVRRWGDGPTVHLNGTPTDEDLATLSDVVSDINALTTTVDMSVVEADASVEVHFVREDQFAQILSSYVPGNVGFFSVWWDSSQRINRAVVLISIEVDQVARNHIIREEVTQILGLMRDSYHYEDSIFQQSWTLVDAYSALDEQLIEMLYRPELVVGSLPDEAVRLLRTLTRDVVASSASVRGPAPVDGSRWGAPGTASGGVARR